MVSIKLNKGLKNFKSSTFHCIDILNCSLDSQVSDDPAHTAARYGSVAALHSLRKNGFNIMLEDQNKVCSSIATYFTFTYPCYRCYIEVEGFYLLQKTSLHIAAEFNHEVVSDYILQHHEDVVNSVDIDGSTPLHLAAFNSCKQCVKVSIENILIISKDLDRFLQSLINHGADINCVNSNGLTPLHISSNHSIIR